MPRVRPTAMASKVLANRAVATEGTEIMRVFGEVAPVPTPISVAFEATFGRGSFADLLQDAGHGPSGR